MRLLLAALLATVATPAFASPQDDYDALTERYWAAQLENSPGLASSVGVKDYDDKLFDYSLEAMDERAAQARFFLTRLRAIPSAQLSASDQVDKAILERSLEAAVVGNRFGQRMMLFSTYSGWHQSMAGMAGNLSFREGADYENYLKRLAAYPAQNAAALSVSSEAVAEGHVLPCVVLDGYVGGITGVVGEDVTTSRLYKPFAAPQPAFVTAEQWTQESVKAHQPVGLIEAMLAHQRRPFQRQHGTSVGNGRESAVINPS